ncbi:ATP-binding protein (plasmid) [Variovorax sp. V213]|uniref:sensor histidine kinase efflux regulator BaeS n=1 Tax=Variovorax sp. V213 TaxID=3065955 RepID=UPI0034E8FA4A
MRVGITAKLFLAVLVACAAVLLVQGVAMRISFERGFLGYLNGQATQRMEEIVPRLVAGYGKHGNWDFLRTDFRAWMDLAVARTEDPPTPPWLTSSDQTGVILRMGVLDTELRHVAGNPQVAADSIRLPVVAGGRTVGWIATVPFEKVLASGEARFLEQQFGALRMIVLASLAVAALLTFVLARALLRRVRGMAGATHRLAAGDYASRVEIGANDELGTLARDFNQLAQTLEHTERARRTFMADISHELRTPLAVLRAELEAIQDGIRPPSASTLEAMNVEIRQLGKLIDDLHDLSRTDVGAMAYRRAPIDLVTVLQAAQASMQRRFEAAGLRLEVSIPPPPLTISGDEARLQQLFGNLLENSLRYTDKGGTARLRCQRRDAVASISIEDSAPGVPEDKLEKLFERFYRLEASRNRASGGSGLGLAICRNIVEAHGGKIVAGPSPLGGLRIHIELPLAAP